MAIVLGPNHYGKAEIHLVRVYRDTARHEIRDVLVSTSLRGDFDAAHVRGDQADVLPTDSQKNAVFAYAKEHGVGEIEGVALALGRYFTGIESVTAARIEVDEGGWQRIGEHDHAFVRSGRESRTTTVTVQADGAHVVPGVKALTVMKSSGSQFRGFRRDRYTTLEEADDRILATALTARWRHLDGDTAPGLVDWSARHAAIRSMLLDAFAATHSRALQHTLWSMGRAVLDAQPDLAEIRLTAPNLHHFVVDLEPFGLDNPGEVFHAADRPYGLIDATVQRDDAPPGPSWSD